MESELQKVYDYGELLGKKMRDAGATDEEEENVCEKLGQYCFIFGIEEKWIDIFFEMWKNNDPLLKMSTIEYGLHLMKK